MEYQACWVRTGCGREPGGVRVHEAGPCPLAADPATVRKRLAAQSCPVIQSGNPDCIRDVVRRLVETAI